MIRFYSRSPDVSARVRTARSRLTLNAEPDLNAIDQLLEAGDLDGARAALAAIASQEDAVRVLRVKLGLYDGSLPAGAAMQRLIQIMRVAPETPRAKELYQEASNQAYQSRQSSVSHSHPPPPVEPDES